MNSHTGHSSVKITDNLYAYIWQEMGNNCNSCLFYNILPGKKPHILIDPGHINNGFFNCFESLTGAVEEDGYNITDVGLIIDTHSHTDHVEANMALSKNNSISIAMSSEEEKFRHTLGKKLDAMFGITTPVFTVNRFIEEGSLELGDNARLKLQVLYTPGHSPGSICLYWPEQKVLITGDVLFYGSVGRTDFPGGDISLLEKSIDKLSKLDIEFLIPGHSTELGNLIEGKKNIERNFQAVKMYF